MKGTQFERIIQYIKQHPNTTINEISEALKISRMTVSKYCCVLENMGNIECKKLGMGKMWKWKK